MINKTIGSGGDYADIGLAWAYLTSLGTLADDYTFNIISNFSETHGAPFGSAGPTFAGRIVSFVNTSYTITTTLGYGFRPDGSSASINDRLVFDGLKINMTGATGNNLFISAPQLAGKGISVTYKNLFLTGAGKQFSETAINVGNSWANSTHILNCRISNFNTGINCSLTDTNSTGIDRQIENNVIYNCDTGITLVSTSTASRNSTIKNTVSFGCLFKDFSSSGSTYNSITNCADSDNTIASSGAILSGNITGITTADFLSIDSGNSDFLKISLASSLFEKGTTSISSWNTVDLDYNPRPHTNGLVSIGAHEGISSTPSGDYYVIDHSVAITKGLIQTWTKTVTARTAILDQLGQHTANRNNPHQVTLAQLYAGTLTVYADNAAAIAAGLAVGKLYRNGDFVCVVH